MIIANRQGKRPKYFFNNAGYAVNSEFNEGRSQLKRNRSYKKRSNSIDKMFIKSNSNKITFRQAQILSTSSNLPCSQP